MATGLGALANIAATYSGSELESESEEEYVEEFKTGEDFIRDGVLSSVVKESVRRVEYAKSVNYRNKLSNGPHITDSSSLASSEEDDSSDSDTSDEDSDEGLGGVVIVGNKEATKEKRSKCPPRVKGELLPSDLPPIEDLHITVPEHECLEVGTVSSIVDEMVVVKSKPNTAALDLDSILFLEKGKRPLGKVFDVIGPVMQPYYCVRFNSRNHILEKKIEVDSSVFFAPRTEHTNFVFLGELMKIRGSDASWKNDKEPPAYQMEYSDDEAERQAKRAHKRCQDGTEKNSSSSRVYVPPAPQVQYNNAFYRRERRYNPRNYGPIQWNSVHTQHLHFPPGQFPRFYDPSTPPPPRPHFRPNPYN